MKLTNIKDFQRNVYSHLKDLPLVITKYNQPVYLILKLSTDGTVEFLKGLEQEFIVKDGKIALTNKTKQPQTRSKARR